MAEKKLTTPIMYTGNILSTYCMNFPLFRKQETVFSATSGERKEVVKKLVTQSSFKGGYHLFLLISTLIVTMGLLINNGSVVIGGMVLAPLIVPILLLALGIVSMHPKSLLRAANTFFSSVGLVVGVACLTTLLVERVGIGHALVPATPRIELYVLIAFCSGIAGAFAWVKEDISTSLPGVAISVSLLPPLATVGIGLALDDRAMLTTAGTIFVANVAGILLASILVFLFFGLSGERKTEEKEIAKTDAV